MGATIKKDDGWEYADVEFRAKPSGSNYCICDACHQSVCEEKLMSALTPLELEEV